MATPGQSKKSVMDVAKPGKTPAGATSRPVIVSHRPVTDPMVTEDNSTEETIVTDANQAPKIPSQTHKIIQPLKEQEPVDSNLEADQGKFSSQDPAPTEGVGDTKSNTSSDTENGEAVVDAVLEQVADKKQSEKTSAEDQKRQEIVDKLVAEKKYFIPLNVAQHRRNHRIVTVLLILLVIVGVATLLLLDAGIVETDFTLPFDFIPN